MLADLRTTKIIEILNKQGSVKVTELSHLLNVTEKTIREDLVKLDNQGILKRVRGGAVLNDDQHALLPIITRQTKHSQEKREIALLAYGFIEEGMTILLDGGSTTIELARLLINEDVTIVTNDIKVAAVFADSDTVNLFVLGGHKRKGSSSIVGITAMEMVKDFNIDLAFIGTTAIDFEKGLSIFNYDEAQYKKVMIKSANYVVLMADHSKFNRTALVTFGELQEINHILTDSVTTEAIVNELTHLGVNVSKVEAKNLV